MGITLHPTQNIDSIAPKSFLSVILRTTRNAKDTDCPTSTMFPAVAIRIESLSVTEELHQDGLGTVRTLHELVKDQKCARQNRTPGRTMQDVTTQKTWRNSAILSNKHDADRRGRHSDALM
jgi:hypothetical protein